MCARKFSLEDQTSRKKQDLGSPVQLTGWANQDQTKSWTSNYFPKDDWISKDSSVRPKPGFLIGKFDYFSGPLMMEKIPNTLAN